jgi:flagellar motor switch protein FliG
MSTEEDVIGEKKLTGLQKAAIFLIAIGPKESAQIVKHLHEEQADRMANANARLDSVAQEHV